MKYKAARLLKPGDQVVRKADQATITIVNIEAYGQYKLVKIFYTDINGEVLSSILSNEVE